MHEISIIIPAYNVAEYIEECLTDLLNQKFKNSFEIIIVDDKSTDNTLQRCQDILKSTPNTRIIQHTANQGCAGARNTGLEKATGQYIAFVDPDDRIPEYALQNLYDAAKIYDADIVKGNNTMFDSKRSTPANYNCEKLSLIESELILSTLLDQELLRGHPWGKLFKKQTIDQIRFPIGVRMAEDLIFCAQASVKAKKMALIPKTVYHYRLRSDGLAGGKYKNGTHLDWINSIETCANLASTSPQKKSAIKLKIRTLLQLIRETRKLPYSQKKEVLEHIITTHKRWNLSHSTLLFTYQIGARAWFRYLKFNIQLIKLKLLTHLKK